MNSLDAFICTREYPRTLIETLLVDSTPLANEFQIERFQDITDVYLSHDYVVFMTNLPWINPEWVVRISR